MDAVVMLSRLLLGFACLQATLGQVFIETPRDVTVREGETALFRCIIRSLQSNQRVYWFRVSTRQFLTSARNIENTPQRNRIALLGNANFGEYFLQIRDTVATDAGIYRCGYAVPGNPLIARSATLTINRPPNPGFPVCEVRPTDLKIGDVASLTCRSEGGIPPAQLTWSLGEQVLTDMKESVNVLAVAVSAEHNGLDFICTARSEFLGDGQRTCSVRLINIPTTARIEPPLNVVDVGERAVFTCVAFGQPEFLTYEWLFNNEPITGINRIEVSRDGRTLIINNVSIYDDETPVHCTVTTINGLSATSGGLLRVTEVYSVTPTTLNITTDFFNGTTVGEGNGKPSGVIIGIIVAAVIVGQILIILLVYCLHRLFNRMMKERRRTRPKQTEMQEQNVYVRGTRPKPRSSPEIDPETGAPTVQEFAVYPDQTGNSSMMGEGIYSGLTQSQQSAAGSSSVVIFNAAPGRSSRLDSSSTDGYTIPRSPSPTPLYGNIDDITPDQHQPRIPPSAPPPLSPSGSAGYCEVPFVEELEITRYPPRPNSSAPSAPARVVQITSPPPNKVPPRLPADQRVSGVPPVHPYQGLNPTRPESQYLSLRHYDDAYADRLLEEGARLEDEANQSKDDVKHDDDDGYVYETPPLEYDVPPKPEKREYTFMGSKPTMPQ